MLAKSKQSAFIMGCLYVISAIVSSVLMEAVSHSEKGIGELIINPEMSSKPISVKIFSWLLLIVVVLLASGLIAWGINKLDETYFGVRSAVLWVVAGFVYAAWVRAVGQSLPQAETLGSEVSVSILRIVGVGISYGAVFWLPRRLGRITRKQKGKRE